MEWAGNRTILRAATSIVLLALAAVAEAAGLAPGLVSDDPIWTDKPVRIDRKKQTYERLAVEPIPLPPLRLRPTTRVTIFDSTSFQEGGRLYVLTDAVAVDPKRFCRGELVTACGQQARFSLRRLIVGKRLTCEEDIRFANLSFVTCTAGGKNIAETLVALGAAWAAAPRLAAMQQDAMRRQAGIWVDAECRALGRCPPRRKR